MDDEEFTFVDGRSLRPDWGSAMLLVSTAFEAEGHVVVRKVPDGWQKFEGKWTMGFGPRAIVYRPFGPVRRRKSDFQEKPVQGAKGTRGSKPVQRGRASG